MNDLEMYREQLGLCDDKIIDALVERNSIVEKIMAYKEEYGMPILQPQQEEEVDRQDHYKLSPLLSWVKTCFFFVNHKIIFHTIRTLCSSPADD